MTESSHTPTPYKGNAEGVITDKSGKRIACCTMDIVLRSADGQMLANRDFIVRACNAHDELVEALRSYLRAPSVGSNGPGSSTIVVQTYNARAARAALKKAEVEL